jgi:hypothetical protein
MKYEILKALMLHTCKLSASAYHDNLTILVDKIVEYEMFDNYAPKWGVDII